MAGDKNYAISVKMCVLFYESLSNPIRIARTLNQPGSANNGVLQNEADSGSPSQTAFGIVI
jgi:hypothetical protein